MDHFLVKTKIQFKFQKLTSTKKENLSRRNTDAVKNNEQIIKYQNEIQYNLNLTNTTDNIESLWSETVIKVAEIEIDTIKSTRNGWFNKEYEEAVETNEVQDKNTPKKFKESKGTLSFGEKKNKKISMGKEKKLFQEDR